MLLPPPSHRKTTTTSGGVQQTFFWCPAEGCDCAYLSTQAIQGAARIDMENSYQGPETSAATGITTISRPFCNVFVQFLRDMLAPHQLRAATLPGMAMYEVQAGYTMCPLPDGPR